MKGIITHVATDAHKKQHRVAVVYPDSGEIQEFTVKNIDKDIATMAGQIKKRSGGQINFCYEAGVCGFPLKRQIDKLGCKCSVIAPSLVPTKPGDRIKIDRRDAKKLLGQFVAGQLTEVYPPDQQQEAASELTRCRQDAQENLKRIRHQLIKFLTRHGYIYSQGRHWTKKHLDWLRSLRSTRAASVAAPVRLPRRAINDSGVFWSRVRGTIVTVSLSVEDLRSDVRVSLSGRLILPTVQWLVCTGVTASCLSGPNPLTKWWWRSHENRPDSFGRFFMSMRIAKLDR